MDNSKESVLDAFKLKLWRSLWRVAIGVMVTGLLLGAYFHMPHMMLICGLLGTATIWLTLGQLEKLCVASAGSDEVTHLQTQLDHVQSELNNERLSSRQYQQEIQQLRDEINVNPAVKLSAPVMSHAHLAAPQSADDNPAQQNNFLATLNHEIRTPMNGLVGMTQMVLQTELNDKQREYVELAHESAKQLMNIINDVLDYSKIQAGHLNLELRPCNPVAVMHQTLRSFYPQAGAKGLTLYYEDVPGNNAPDVLLDPMRLRQVMSNLIGNAIKFTDQGFVQTSIELVASEKPDSWQLQFEVQDSGIGFDAHQTEAMFRAFHKGAQISDPFTGAGLGLAISRELVLLMGGQMVVTSSPKQGSTFKFTIPCAPANAVTDTHHSIAPALKRTEQSLHILVAEDHPVNMKLLNLLLDQMGHTYAKAADGEEAVKLFAQQRFDLVLMDVMMPVMDGMTAMGHLRQSQGASRQDTPVIMVTAYAMNMDRQRFLEAGADGYVSKPIDAQLLQAEIARLVPRLNTTTAQTA